MIRDRLQEFFGDDWEETVGSLKSAPGAFGNIMLATVRQVRVVDALAFALVLVGWAWIIVGYGAASDRRIELLLLALLPSALWLAAGVIGGLVFEISGIGYRSLGYWEAYLLILLFAVFGVISLRLALNPQDRHVYRGGPNAGA